MRIASLTPSVSFKGSGPYNTITAKGLFKPHIQYSNRTNFQYFLEQQGASIYKDGYTPVTPFYLIPCQDGMVTFTDPALIEGILNKVTPPLFQVTRMSPNKNATGNFMTTQDLLDILG